jgi:Protein of unknown function (DUF1593).
MKRRSILLVLGMLGLVSCSRSVQESLKPRIVVMTDIGPAEVEPDDNESAVRLMAYADRFEIEGIITTIGWNCDPYPEEWAVYLERVIDAYEVDVKNLMKRSRQEGFRSPEQENGRQELGYWPSADYLRGRAVMGSKRAGIGVIGPDNDSPGSELLIRLADEDDDRPIWLCSWGGANTFAQAIWRVQQERSEAELKRFLRKFRLYTITDQDMVWAMRMDRAYSSHQWLRRDFADDLMLVWDESAWLNQNELGKANWDKYERFIQGKGEMGKVYPKFLWGVEGDTPSFLHVIPNGLNDPDDPEQVGWGGYHRFGLSPDGETSAWTNWQQPLKDISNAYEHKFYPDEFNDFAARMQWADTGAGDLNPVVVIDGDNGIKPLEIDASPGEILTFDASRSYDPDGYGLSFDWWFQEFPGQTRYPVIDQPQAVKVRVTVPDTPGTYHLVCEIHDDGPFRLPAYRRIIVKVK